jgi:hypothetical protein
LPGLGHVSNPGRVKPSVLLVCLAALGQAPLQCGSEPDHSLRRNETPDEALYGLAEKFKAQGNEAAWRDTLEYLVERYPNSRYATRARQDLEGDVEPTGDEP